MYMYEYEYGLYSVTYPSGHLIKKGPLSFFSVAIWTSLPHPLLHVTKAGMLVGLADCYAVIALANNATFLLAVNRIAVFW